MKKATFKTRATKIGKTEIPSKEIVEYYSDDNSFADVSGLRLRASALNWDFVSLETVEMTTAETWR